MTYCDQCRVAGTGRGSDDRCRFQHSLRNVHYHHGTAAHAEMHLYFC